MTAVRWIVDFPQDQLGTGGWIEYPDERTARAHASTAATVWALVPAEAVDVLRAAVRWRRDGSVADQFALNVAIDAYAPRALDRATTTPTRPTGIPHSAAEPPAHLALNSGTNPPRSQRYGQTQTAHGASETNS